MWWLLQVLGQRDPVALSGFEYPREKPVPLWSAWTVNSLRFGDQFQVKQLYFPQNKLHVKLTSSDVILLLPNEFLCACKAGIHRLPSADCAHCTCWVGSFSFHRLGYTTGQDRDRSHCCLPGMETSPATFLSPRVAFTKWSSCFGLHKSSLEAFSSGDVTLHAPPGLSVMWAHRVFHFSWKIPVQPWSASSLLKKLYLAHFRDCQCVSVFELHHVRNALMSP